MPSPYQIHLRTLFELLTLLGATLVCVRLGFLPRSPFGWVGLICVCVTSYRLRISHTHYVQTIGWLACGWNLALVDVWFGFVDSFSAPSGPGTLDIQEIRSRLILAVGRAILPVTIGFVAIARALFHWSSVSLGDRFILASIAMTTINFLVLFVGIYLLVAHMFN